ncbi:hypothetical protein SteCoe_18921 [Stentor coeruleus]|uniref:Thioredoxin domain-containing protein n=1 Tax=Stentor coeruleus TaxID=5963 RepID=A0A1R2BVA8_9CILI|nr:hypothetical protein SteCoe_18921 [Stentor coeruleus]
MLVILLVVLGEVLCQAQGYEVREIFHFIDTVCFYSLNIKGEAEGLFLEAGRDFRVRNNSFKLIDCIEHHEYCVERKIKSFPSVYYHGEDKMFEYTWSFTVADFVEFGIKMQSNNTKTISTLEDFELINSFNKPFYLLFYRENDKILSEFNYVDIFSYISGFYKSSNLYFATTSSKTISKLYHLPKIQTPILYNFSPNSTTRPSLKFPFTGQNIKEFIESTRCNNNFQITQSNFYEQRKCFDGKLLGISFIDKNNKTHISQISKHKSIMITLNAYNDTKFRYGFVDLNKFPSIGKKFHVYESYSFVIRDYRENKGIVDFGERFFRDTDEIYSVYEAVWNKSDVKEFVVMKKPRTIIRLRYLLPGIAVVVGFVYKIWVKQHFQYRQEV